MTSFHSLFGAYRCKVTSSGITFHAKTVVSLLKEHNRLDFNSVLSASKTDAKKVQSSVLCCDVSVKLLKKGRMIGSLTQMHKPQTDLKSICGQA